MSGFPIGQRIADPRVLSDELGGDPGSHDMYSSLADYSFGSPPTPTPPPTLSEPAEPISPLAHVPRRPSPDHTPRPSLAPHSPPFRYVSSHPSQGAGFLASYSRPAILAAPARGPDESDAESSQDTPSSVDPIIAAFSASRRGTVVPDDASQHTFGHASRSHGVTAAVSRDGVAPSSSSVSVATSRSSSRASMRTIEQFSSDDELEIDYYGGSSSPVTFARDYLVDIDEDILVDSLPSRFQSFDRRRGSLPMAIPGVIQSNDPYARSREGSILTVRRPSRSLDDSSTYRSSHSVEDPTLVLPKSEPVSRAGRLSLEDQLQAKQQAVDPNAFQGLDLQYILSKRSEGSIRSFGSRLSFVKAGAAAPRISSPYSIPLALGSTTTLPFEDSFMRHIQKHDRTFDAFRYYWSFQREKADPSSSSSRRRQQTHHYRTEKSPQEIPSRVQEMWRCGHVGRFKVDRLVFKPQSADPTKAAQQRIQIRHIPDPYSVAGTISGPHSVIHKHSRAVAFSIFRSHSLFSGSRQVGGLPSAPTHMNTRSGTMLALKKVQEQYTSTKTTRSLGPFQSGDKKSGDQKEGNKGKSKSKSSDKTRSRDKSSKRHRQNATESAGSSTATNSAGSVTNSAVHLIAPPLEHPETRAQLSPSVSSSVTVYRQESINRPVSSASLLSSSLGDPTKTSESEPSLSSVPPIRYHRDHRDSIDSDDLFHTRTTHAEAFSTLDPNDILRAKAHGRSNADSSSAIERFFRIMFRSSPKADDHTIPNAHPGEYRPPWMSTAGRDQQEANDRVLDDLNASFRDVGLLHTNPPKPQKAASKQKAKEGGVLDQIPDDCLYMLLPLWPGETDTTTTASILTETSSTASFSTAVENRQFLLVYYVPFREANPKDKKNEKKKVKLTGSSDSGTETDARAYLPAFRVVARVVTYDELQLSGIRIPSNGLAINGPEWEAINYPSASSLRDIQMTDTVVCQCQSREHGFDFQEHGLFKLGLCTREESSVNDNPSESGEEGEQEGKAMLTPIGRAAVEMIWLGCLAVTSFGPS